MDKKKIHTPLPTPYSVYNSRRNKPSFDKADEDEEKRGTV